MPTKKRAMADRRLRWMTVVKNFRIYSDELPHLQKDVDELRTLEEEVTALVNEQARLQAQAQATTKRIRVLSNQADNLRGRIGSALRAHFGFTSKALLQLGFRPLPSRDRLERDLEFLETPSPVANAVGKVRGLPPAAAKREEPDQEG